MIVLLFFAIFFTVTWVDAIIIVCINYVVSAIRKEDFIDKH